MYKPEISLEFENYNVKRGESSQWLVSLYCHMRNLDQITVGKRHLTLFLVTYDDRTATPTSLILSSDMNPVAFEIRPDFDSDPALDDQLPYDPEL